LLAAEKEYAMFTATNLELFLATLAFVGGHFAISSTPLRAWLVGRLGERGYLGLFSLLMTVAMGWMVLSYIDAPVIVIWPPWPGMRYVPLVVMPVSLILAIAALRPDSPTMVGGESRRLTPASLGLFAVTRHPFLWGAALWALAHMTVNSDIAPLILMGGILTLALGGTVAIDAKLRTNHPEAWRELPRHTSNLPFAALLAGRAELRMSAVDWLPVVGGLGAYPLLLATHQWLFGVSPFPLR